MSDFLTRLASRTLGLEPVVQPIIAPMFAPNTLNDNLQGLVQSNGFQSAWEKTQGSHAQETQFAFSKSDLAVKTRFPEIANDHPGIMANHNYGVLKPVSKPVNSTSLLESKDSKANYDVLKPVSKLNFTSLPESKNSKAKVSDPNEHNKLSTDMVIWEQNQRNSLENTFNENKNVSGTRILLDKLKTTRQDIPTASKTQYAETFTSMNDSYRRFNSQIAATSESSSSTPTIQVTIGRIEVRAIPPPVHVTPAQRPRTPSPNLSLDEYLKQRNGGQR